MVRTFISLTARFTLSLHQGMLWLLTLAYSRLMQQVSFAASTAALWIFSYYFSPFLWHSVVRRTGLLLWLSFTLTSTSCFQLILKHDINIFGKLSRCLNWYTTRKWPAEISALLFTLISVTSFCILLLEIKDNLEFPDFIWSSLFPGYLMNILVLENVVHSR